MNQHPSAYEADALPLSYAPVDTSGRRLELNQQLPHYEGGALPIELLRRCEGARQGLRPWGFVPLSAPGVSGSPSDMQ